MSVPMTTAPTCPFCHPQPERIFSTVQTCKMQARVAFHWGGEQMRRPLLRGTESARLSF